MKEYDDYSAKEQQQLAVCQRLISEKSYLSQEEIRRDLQNEGFEGISQSTVSRLLKLLGAICNAVNNFGLMCNQFWIAILATHDPELSISVLTPAL